MSIGFGEGTPSCPHPWSYLSSPRGLPIVAGELECSSDVSRKKFHSLPVIGCPKLQRPSGVEVVCRQFAHHELQACVLGPPYRWHT